MTITGLNSDLYFANNPIFIRFNDISADVKYIEYFTQLSDIDPVRIYTHGRTTITVDIAPLIKLTFPRLPHNTDYSSIDPIPVNNNCSNVTLIFKVVTKSGLEIYLTQINKTFIRGGKRTYESNQNWSINRSLLPDNIFPESNAFIPINMIPRWGGYPIDYYYFDENKVMMKSNILPTDRTENREIKGCNPVYVKFINSVGGYSYWLFENSERVEKIKNLGIVERQNDFLDLGNTLDEEINVTSKVPRKYMNWMFDLISSNEIYIYIRANKWEKVKSDSNNVNQNLFNTNEKVKIKFNKVHRYNPTLI